MRLPWLVGSLCVALAPRLTASASVPPPQTDPCTGDTQLDNNTCAASRYDAADTQLNERYTKLRRVLAARLRDEHARLQSAQRRWIAYRDAHCEWQASPYLDGSIYPQMLFGCLETETTRRAEVIGERLLELTELTDGEG